MSEKQMRLGALVAGGTKMVCAVVSGDGEVLDRMETPTLTPAETVPQMVEWFTARDVDALGIGAFGPTCVDPNDERFGPRFPDMTEPYSLELRNLAKQTADELGIAYKEGVYMGFMGPCYETAAEIRAFAGMGADAVGMSTVPETMVCSYMGMKVLAVSCITNMATGIQTVKHSHARVLEIANQAGDTLCRWLGAVIHRME